VLEEILTYLMINRGYDAERLRERI